MAELIETEEGYPRKKETKVTFAPKHAYEVPSNVWLNHELRLHNIKFKEPNGKTTVGRLKNPSKDFSGCLLQE